MPRSHSDVLMNIVTNSENMIQRSVVNEIGNNLVLDEHIDRVKQIICFDWKG